MSVYRYEGPVKNFDRIVADKWVGETTANSEEKARNNLRYQAKKAMGLAYMTKISLPGKLIVI